MVSVHGQDSILIEGFGCLSLVTQVPLLSLPKVPAPAHSHPLPSLDARHISAWTVNLLLGHVRLDKAVMKCYVIEIVQRASFHDFGPTHRRLFVDEIRSFVPTILGDNDLLQTSCCHHKSLFSADPSLPRINLI